MLRKDVKLGFVIGGLLLTVVVVYALFVGGDERPQGAQLDTGDEFEMAQASAPEADEPVHAEPPPVIAQQPSNEIEPVAEAESPSVSSAEDAWVLALNHGTAPPMLTATPSPQQPQAWNEPSGASSEAPVAVTDDSVIDPEQPLAADEQGPEIATDDMPSDVVATPTAVPTPTSTVTARTHIVQRGESLAKISEIVYGSQAYWPHILRANPGIVAENIRPGLVLNLPDESEVKVLAADATVAREQPAEQAIDPKTQYKVAPGDTLEKISIKLYGKGERWDDIYDVNKEKIGSNPHALKVNMILTLPDEPTKLSTASSN